jgi:phage baseplate assembly protein gpV
MMTEISLAQAEEMARVATQSELGSYEVPAELMGQVVLTTLFEGDDRVFVLYVPGETRQDQMIVARTTVNVKTGELFVEVPVLSRKAA